MSSLSFESASSSSSSSIPLKTWEECKTLPEKFGFVLGRGIPFCCSKISQGISFTARLVRLDKGAQHCQNAAKSVLSCFSACWKKTNTYCQPIFARLPSTHIRTRVRAQTPCCEKMVRAMGRICRTMSENCAISCRKFLSLIRPCTDCIGSVESRVDVAFGRAFNACCAPLCTRLSKCSSSLCNASTKLFRDYVAAPACGFFDGLAGGCCGKKDVPVQEVELDDMAALTDEQKLAAEFEEFAEF